MSKTHKATVLAWMSQTSLSYRAQDLSGDDPVAAVEALSYYFPADVDAERRKTWEDSHICVGTAEITLTLKPADQMAEAQITTLRAAKKKVLADAQMEATNIERQIQTLLAIANEVPA